MTTTLQVIEATFKEHGYTYSRWQVTGYVNGKRVRFRAKNKQHAQLIKIREESKGVNANRGIEYLPTHLTQTQLDEAEAVIEKIGRVATLMEVYEFWRSHHVNAGEQITLADAVTRFLAFRESRVRPDSYTAEKSCLNKFAEFVGNESAVNEVTSQTVVRFLDSIRDRKGVNAASNKTWNNTRGALLTFFGWTTKKPQQFTAQNIVADIEPKAKEDKDIQIVTAAQVSSLMGHVSTLKDGRYARFFALAAFAGIRPDGELGKLEERDIDLENGVIKIRKEVSKVKKSRQITIEPNLRSWLVKLADQPLNAFPPMSIKRSNGSSHPDTISCATRSAAITCTLVSRLRSPRWSRATPRRF